MSPALKTALQGNQELLRCQLYTITLLSGTVLRYTDWGSPLTMTGHTWLSPNLDSCPGFVVGKTTTAIGLQVDDTEVDLLFDASTRMSGVTPAALAAAGGLDGAIMAIDTLFMLPSTPGNTGLGTVNRYTGIIDQIRTQTGKLAMKVSSRLALLNGAFPRNYAVPQCNHALFDTGCTLVKASFAINGSITGGVSQTGFTDSARTQPADYFSQGSVVWLTGANAGITSQVLSFNGAAHFTLTYPLPAVPSIGDTYTAYPGCSKTRAACGQTNPAVGPAFNNLLHFRGFPYVPTPETIMLGGSASTPGDNSGGNAGPGGGGVGRGPGGAGGRTAAK